MKNEKKTPFMYYPFMANHAELRENTTIAKSVSKHVGHIRPIKTAINSENIMLPIKFEIRLTRQVLKKY